MTLLPRLHTRLRDHFWSWGWLLPVFFPLFRIVGRAPSNIMIALTFLWSVLFAREIIQRSDRKTLFFVGLLALSFLPGGFYAQDLARFFKHWFQIVAALWIFLALLAALGSDRKQIDRFLTWLSFASCAVLVLIFALWGYQYLTFETFVPTLHMHEDNMPFLLFLLVPAGVRLLGWSATKILLIAGLPVLAYILVSQGRAALAGLLVAIFLFLVSDLQQMTKRSRLLWASGAVMVLCVIVLTSGSYLFRTAETGMGTQQLLDSVTTGRTILWRQALQNPPENILVGVGLGNVRFYEDVVSIHRSMGTEVVRHLHNFVVDCYYETGLLGLGAYFVFLAYAISHFRRACKADSLAARCLLAGVAAILIAGLFSYSYTSLQFRHYMPMMFAVIFALAKLSDQTLESSD